MNVTILPDAAAIGRAAGDLICAAAQQNPAIVLGLATGASPLPCYARIIQRHQAGEVSFAGARSFNLDEYCGLPESDPNSYRSFMRKELFSQIDILPENTHFLDGNAPDEAAECARFTAAMQAAGGIDLQLLGIGRNGHIGFNEPGDAFTGEAYKTRLSESTIAANSVYFSQDDMPRYAMTMGVGSILRAREILLIATGEAKAEAVRSMIEGELSPACPATALQQHEHVTIFLDEAAASLLKKD